MEITIPHRYCGPPESGNGGWVCGTVAAHVPTTVPRPAVTVRLASPPPLDRPLALKAEAIDGAILVRLLDRGHLVASGTASADLVDDVPPAVTLEQARAAETRFEGLADHPFPTCFACGTGRDPGCACGPARSTTAPAGTPRPGSRTRPTARWSGPRSTAPAAGRRASPGGRWCSAR